MKSIASIPSEAIDTHPKTPSSSSSPKHVSSIFVPLPILPHTPSLNAAPHQQRHQHQHRSSSSSSITLSPGSSTTPQSPSHPHSIAGPDSKCDLEIIEQTPIFKSKETAKSWKVLAGCCIIAFTCMGYGMVQGAYQSYYSTIAFPQVKENIIALVGGLLAFSCTALAGLTGRVADRYGYKPTILIGMILGVSSLIFTAFATELWQVFLAQGLLFGFAQSFVVPMILSLPSQWFDTHRALATGIVGSAAGWGGGTLAIATRLLITRFGTVKYPLLIFAGIYAITWGIGFMLLEETQERMEFVREGKRRRKEEKLMKVEEKRWKEEETEDGLGQETEQGVGKRKVKVKGWSLDLGGIERSSVFRALWMGVVISTFSYLAPFQYIGTYTTDILPELQGTFKSAMPLVSMAWGLGLGRIGGGQFADRIGAIQTLVIAFFMAGILQLVAWHFATTFAGIIAFSICYGLFGGAALSLIPVVVKQLFPDAKDRFASVVGLVMMSTAPGQLAGASAAGAILNAAGGKWIAFQVFSGFLQIVGGLAAMWAWYRGIGLRFGNVRRILPEKQLE